MMRNGQIPSLFHSAFEETDADPKTGFRFTYNSLLTPEEANAFKKEFLDEQSLYFYLETCENEEWTVTMLISQSILIERTKS
jgi:hypothetical protein